MVGQWEGVVCGFNQADALLWGLSQFCKFLKQITLFKTFFFKYIHTYNIYTYVFVCLCVLEIPANNFTSLLKNKL